MVISTMYRIRRCALFATFLASSLLLFASPAIADNTNNLEFIEGEDDFGDGDRPEGLHGNLGVEASFNLVSNHNRVGQADGLSLHLGGGLNGDLDYFQGDHALRNTLNYNTSWARTPSLEKFVKNNDLAELESLYNYYITDWMGPFARASVETSAFRTNFVTPGQREYEITRIDGTTDTVTTDQLRLADPFRPIELFESVGVSLEPVRDERLSARMRLGAGGRQSFTRGVLSVTDEPSAEEAGTVRELDNVIQAGAEAFVGLEGRFPEQRIQYRVGATSLVPLINNDETERTALELTRIGLTANARVALFDWMGLNYNLRVLNDPQLVEGVQVQNSLLLTFNYTLLDTDGGDE